MRRVICIACMLLWLVGLFPGNQVSRALAATREPAFEVTLSNNGVVPADGQPHTMTVTVTAQGKPVVGAAVYVMNIPAGMTGDKGKQAVSLKEVESRVIPIRAVAPGGAEKTAWAAALASGDGAVRVRAVDRAGKPIAGRANIAMDIDWTIPEEGALLILREGVHRGYFHAWDPSGDRLFLEGSFTVKAGQKSAVTLYGNRVDLVPLTVQSAGTSGYIEINRAEDPYRYPSAFAARSSGGGTRVWLLPGVWDVVHRYETKQDQYLLTGLSSQVGDKGAVVTLKAENLVKIMTSLQPGMRAEGFSIAIHVSQKAYWPQYFAGARPLYVTPGTYPSIGVSFSQGGRHHSWVTETFGADRPVTLETGEVYALTVGGAIRASIHMERVAPPGAEVTGTAVLGNENGRALVSGSTLTVTVVGPDAEEVPVTVGWDHTFSFVPTAVGRYTVTAAHADAGPLANGEKSVATAYLDVAMPKFTLAGEFSGPAVGDPYRIGGALHEGVQASVMEMVLGDDWGNGAVETKVGPDGRFAFSGILSGSLPDGEGAQVRVRIKGEPASEVRFMGLVDDEAPVILSAEAKIIGLRLVIAGAVADNWRGGIAGVRLEYGTKLRVEGAECGTVTERLRVVCGPGVESADLSTHFESPVAWRTASVDLLDLPAVDPSTPATFTIRSALRLTEDQYAIRLQFFDRAGNQSEWHELTVERPRVTLTLWPEHRFLYQGQSSQVTVSVLQDGEPVSGLTVRLSEQDRTLGEASTGAQGTAMLTVLPGQQGIITVSLLAGSTVIAETGLAVLPPGSRFQYDAKNPLPWW